MTFTPHSSSFKVRSASSHRSKRCRVQSRATIGSLGVSFASLKRLPRISRLLRKTYGSRASPERPSDETPTTLLPLRSVSWPLPDRRTKPRSLHADPSRVPPVRSESRRRVDSTRRAALFAIVGAPMTTGSHFPPGARVLVDGRDEAIVIQAFPEGSTSYLFPHYKLRVIGSYAEVFAVAMPRVGVDRKHP